MVSSKNNSRFQQAALRSGLLTQLQLHRAEQTLEGRGEEVSDGALADLFVEMDVLTRYQADQLKVGRAKLNLGPYVVTDWIGQGGMGQVYKAVHQVMGREVAVKVLPQDKSTPEAIANFSREIRTQAKLDHPNLVRAYDAGEDGNVHYLVVEYVPGTDLRKLIRSQAKPLSMRQAASVIMQAAHGLAHAHQSGLIHRDVKPGNILVTPDGIAKVSDLGLSGFLDDAENDPRAGKIVGTADYLSPEQIRAPREVTPISDIYSLGCTLYYAISGKVPFPGGSIRDKTRRHLHETPWHPRRFNPELSEEFVEIIADMMEKEPSLRIQSASEVASRLEPWAVDVSPISTRPMTRSPWMPPPIPVGREEDDLQDTDAGSYDEPHEPSSQMSHSTSPLSNGETLPPAPLTVVAPRLRDPEWDWQSVLAIALPCLAVGIVLGYLLAQWTAG